VQKADASRNMATMKKNTPRQDVVTLLLLSEYFEADEFQILLKQAQETDRSFWDILLEQKRITEDVIAELFSRRLKVPRVNLSLETLDPALKPIPEKLAREHMCIPLRMEGRKLVLCIANPADLEAVREVEFQSGCSVAPVVATRSDILTVIDRVYSQDHSLDELLKGPKEDHDLQVFQPEPSSAVELDDHDSLEAANLGPVVKLVNMILMGALAEYASDIHIEPGENEVQVRTRVDGLLRDGMVVPKWLHNGMVSRIKILANMDISEKRRPQDGRISVNFRKKRVDLRVSSLPTRDGEKVVMRVLGSGKSIPTVTQLGMESAEHELLKNAIAQSQGMILVTGPTGSGKTTTLYSALTAKMTPELNIVTIEDPIEFHLPGANQVQVAPKAGMTFAGALRSILRQDPDVVLVGEIRDEETAEIAFHAAMTGHLVLSSLHTNSALATVQRLLKLGIEPFLVSSSVNLIIAQRLIRMSCKNCREPYQPARRLLERIGMVDSGVQFLRGKGCPDCGGSGYSGRLGLYEVLPFTPEVQDAVEQKLIGEPLLKVAKAAGMRLLVEDGMEKIRKGLTTIEEVLRVVTVSEQAPTACPSCGTLIRAGSTECPQCDKSTRRVCDSCQQELQSEWKVCPYCSVPVIETGETGGRSEYVV